MDSSETKLVVTGASAARGAKAERRGQGPDPDRTRGGSLHTTLVRYGILALVAVICFAIAAFALGVWSAYAHYQNDYAQTGAWTAWFNGPILARDQQLTADTLPAGAHAAYFLVGDLTSVSARGKTVNGDADADGFRYFLASSPQDGKQLFGTWVASNSFISGRKQATTPVIIDQRTARRLGVGPGDTITLDVKMTDELSNEVQGRFSALVTAVARPTSEFQGVALTSPAMARFVSSARQVAATDLYVFGGADSTPQKLAGALSPDQIKGALRSEMVKAISTANKGRATALRYGIAGVVILVLAIYALGELRFSIPGWRCADKNGLFSLRRARLRTAVDALACFCIFAAGLAAGTLLANGVIRALLKYEPVRATTIQTAVLLAFVSLALLVARVLFALFTLGRRELAVPVDPAPRATGDARAAGTKHG